MPSGCSRLSNGKKETMDSKISWLLVAQKAKARVYEVDQSKSVKLVQQFDHPSGRLKDHEVNSDRLGRTFSSGGASRHAYTQEHGPAEQSAINFSKEIAHFLNKCRTENRFGSLQLVAGPSFLGSLRHEMSPETCALITSELDKNLSGFTDHELAEYMRAI